MEPFFGDIRIFAYPVNAQGVPSQGNLTGWLPCDGRSLPVAQNQALYSLIGFNYGGSGANFNIPDLRGRIPIGAGTGPTGNLYQLAHSGGTETVTLTSTQVPTHTHQFNMSQAAGTSPALADNHVLGTVVSAKSGTSPVPLYANYSPSSSVALNPNSIEAAGGNQSHANMQPYLALGFFIATTGIYPTRS